MTSKFLNPVLTSVTDGSTNIFAATLSALNLTPSFPLKTDVNSVLVSELLDIADVDGLQTELNTLTAAIGGQQASKNPSGFIDRTEIANTWDNGTRTFTITPVGANYGYYVQGTLYTNTVLKTSVITDTEGLWFFYWDTSGVLQNTQSITVSDTAKRYSGVIATIYWDSTNSQQIYFTGDNAVHENNISGQTSFWMQKIAGLLWTSGNALNTITVNQNGNTNSDAQFGVDIGTCLNEDQELSFGPVGSTTGLPIYYRSGANADWRLDTNAGYSVKSATTGSLRLAWNEFTGGSWTQTEVGNLDFVLCHIFITTGQTNSILALQGTTDYNNLGNARDGALQEMKDIIALGGLPFIDFAPIGTVIFQTGNGYSNAVKARIRDTSSGGDYIDFRGITVGSEGTSSNNHSILSGLTNDDHFQYALLGGRTGDILSIDTIIEQTGANGVDIETIKAIDGRFVFPNSTNTSKLTLQTSPAALIGTQSSLSGQEIEICHAANVAFRIGNALKSVVNATGFEADIISEITGSGNGCTIEGIKLDSKDISVSTGTLTCTDTNLSLTSSTNQVVSFTSVGDVTLNLIADSDNNPENDNPVINFLQDAGSTAGHIGLEGDTNNSYSGSTFNSLYLACTGASTTIEMAFGGQRYWNMSTAGMKLDVINELTTNNGIDIEACHFEDSIISSIDDIQYTTSGQSLTGDANGLTLKLPTSDSFSIEVNSVEVANILAGGMLIDQISELGTGGVGIEQINIKDQIISQVDRIDFSESGQKITSGTAAMTFDCPSLDFFSFEIAAIQSVAINNNGIQLIPATANRLLSTNASKELTSIADPTAWIKGGDHIQAVDNGDGTSTYNAIPTRHQWDLGTSSGTTHTLVNGDYGKLLNFTGSSASQAWTINTGLTAGFTCRVMITGTGSVLFGGSATLHSATGGTFSTQYEVVEILYEATNTYILRS